MNLGQLLELWFYRICDSRPGAGHDGGYGASPQRSDGGSARFRIAAMRVIDGLGTISGNWVDRIATRDRARDTTAGSAPVHKDVTEAARDLGSALRVTW